MNILLISECHKQALPETRRVLDQFAERKGSRTWQTPITHEGLKTLRMMLKKTARRNTAVACYWIRAKNQTELLWIVGNRRKFNHLGTVPTNITQQDILKTQDENPMNSIQSVAILAGLAGLFHDFGKANKLFQNKLKPKSKFKFEPYRHEWLSLLLFNAFVEGRTDKAWLTDLAEGNAPAEDKLISQFTKEEKVEDIPFIINQLKNQPIAQCVAWLIVSHHRMLRNLQENCDVQNLDLWMTGIDARWNSCNFESDKFAAKDKKANISFPLGTPFKSATWKQKAREIGKRALNLPNFSTYANLQKALPLHLARMALMLADHCYSADDSHKKWIDPRYKANANTDRKNREIKQKLDEHCVGVAHNAYLLAKILPRLRASMPAITDHKGFKRRSTNTKFRWQDQAFDSAYAIADKTETQGFFGVNIASTGKGKTFANARIMYALANPDLGCRFSVALGLRTLTLQTGEALQDRLNLESDDVAVHIGSQAVSDLFNLNKKQSESSLEGNESLGHSGSESESIFPEHEYVRYDGQIEHSYLDRWLKNQGEVQKLVSAPISISTIDQLISVSEGITGGRQIAPMLRLLTADVVIDEPDDFSLEDDPALARFIYFAGLLGSRVLLSSATLPPALVNHLFACYRAGRAQFNSVTGEEKDAPVCCLWCDEFKTMVENASEIAEFAQHHNRFTTHRIQKLNETSQHLHKGDWLPIDETDTDKSPIEEFSTAAFEGIKKLASKHFTTSEQSQSEGKTVSVGIVRMANIEPLVAVAKKLITTPAPENTRIHYCIYHSHHPLAVRSAIENQLDALLQRDRINLQDIVTKPTVEEAFKKYPEQHHIFVVLATPVAEVGRDHDYDWAIIEPSSMRSIIQMSGRVQRHRQQSPKTTNILIANKNIRALKGRNIAYTKPGFESLTDELTLPNHDLKEILAAKFITDIHANTRINTQYASEPNCDFIKLEHQALRNTMKHYATPLWNSNVASHTGHLLGELQKQKPFRAGQPLISYVIVNDNEGGNFQLNVWDAASREWINSGSLETSTKMQVADRISFWGSASLESEIARLAENFSLSSQEASERFATIQLPALNAGKLWHYDQIFGVFQGTN